MRSGLSLKSGRGLPRWIGIALLAGTAAGCSSDASRFAYNSADELMTASVPAPAADGLAPVGLVPPSSVGQGGYQQASAYPPAAGYPTSTYPTAPQAGYPQASYPQAYPPQAPMAPSAVSQAFPGDYRQPLRYDPASTGSVPGAVMRSAASPRSLLPAVAAPTIEPVRQAVTTAAQPAVRAAGAIAAIPAAVTKPLARPALAAPLQTAAALSQPFPSRPSATTQPTARVQDEEYLAPDPITTGSAQLGSTTNTTGTGWTTAGATRVAIQPGETIYNLSKRYGVPASEIMKANGISDPSRVAAGQQILIPVYVYSRQAPVSAPDADPRTSASKSGTGLVGEANPDKVPLPAPAPTRDVAVLPSVPQPRAPQNAPSQQPGTMTASNRVTEPQAERAAVIASTGVYVVKSGDTLSKIAKINGVRIDALKAANNLSGSNIRIGQKLVLPEAGATSPDRSTQTASVNNADAASNTPSSVQPRGYTPPVRTAEDSVAAKTKADTASVAPASTGIGKLRWPVRGQVITGFAKTENGKRNDGIDISIPAGSPIKAAENGVVIYSGDGLKDYGNTVLVRHDDGLVTVYAHAQSLSVKRGDKVTRGQTLALSGMTGSAKTPRLHFEVRKNAAPVNPVQYLE